MEELLFKCEICGNEFDPDPDAMVPVEVAGYLVTNDDVELMGEDVMAWEGTSSLRNKPIKNFIHTIVPVPPEFANNSMCVCATCRAEVT